MDTEIILKYASLIFPVGESTRIETVLEKGHKYALQDVLIPLEIHIGVTQVNFHTETVELNYLIIVNHELMFMGYGAGRIFVMPIRELSEYDRQDYTELVTAGMWRKGTPK